MGLVIPVRDTFDGDALANLRSIGAKFVRGRRVKSPAFENTCAGLAIFDVNRNGRIALVFITNNNGSVNFIIRLPLARRSGGGSNLGEISAFCFGDATLIFGRIVFKRSVQDEVNRLEAEKQRQEYELRLLLLPRDPDADKNVVMEIRQGAGGDEAALFGAMLMRMYMRYAERHGWKTEMLEASMTELGGVKEAVFAITGEGAFSRLKYESGVHRVQRIPVTESNGKRQTSTATVAVLPEAEEVDVKINPDDLRIDVYRASGHGGQYINKTDSAVRITHIPSGIVVTCQDEKSQLKNKEKAMRVLRARLYEKLQEEKDAAYASDRRAQVGTGDRSERIRTYNFNEGRVTDHRIGKTIYAIDAFVDGDMDDIIDPLIYADQQEQLRALGQGEWQRG